MSDFAPNPEAIVTGVVRSVRVRTFEGESKGRLVGVLTRTGFLEVRVPVAHDAAEFIEDSVIVVAVDVNFWSMVDEKTGLTKSGLVLAFNRHVTQLELTGLEAALSLVA